MSSELSFQMNMEEEVINPVTIQFCEDCNNMLAPFSEDNTLVYKCMKPNCEFKIRISGDGKFENLVSRKEFLKEKNLIIDPDYAVDPTMPRENVECPTCGHQEAVFLISTDIEDTKIELIYICGNVRCGHTWKKQVKE